MPMSGNPTYEAPREQLTPEQAREQAMAEQARADAAAQAAQTTQATADAISGPGTGVLNISGSSEARQGGLEGLQLGQMLYGQGIGDVGKEAGDYSSRVKGLLSKDYAGADVQRQLANQNLAKSSAKMGLGATNTFGAQEQLRRQGSMQAAMMNQDYQDKALALYGKNVSAKQSGLASTYFGAKGTGQANTPTPVQSSGGGSIICTELYAKNKISKYEYLKASVYGYCISPNTYIGYLTIAEPIVKLMKKSDKFSNLFIGWAKSIAAHKPNTLTKILMPICWMVGYVRQIKKEKNARIA